MARLTEIQPCFPLEQVIQAVEEKRLETVTKVDQVAALTISISFSSPIAGTESAFGMERLWAQSQMSTREHYRFPNGFSPNESELSVTAANLLRGLYERNIHTIKPLLSDPKFIISVSVTLCAHDLGQYVPYELFIPVNREAFIQENARI